MPACWPLASALDRALTALSPALSPALQDIYTRKTSDMRDIKNFINGEYVTNASGKTYENRNPLQSKRCARKFHVVETKYRLAEMQS